MVDSGSVSLNCAQTLTGHADRVWSVVWYNIIYKLALNDKEP